MDDDLTQLLQFYEDAGPEAIGHGVLDLEREWQTLIERFIHGQCDDAERERLARFLQSRPRLITQIVERIESAQPDSKDSAAPP